jgi:hypothetical protein
MIGGGVERFFGIHRLFCQNFREEKEKTIKIPKRKISSDEKTKNHRTIIVG